MKINLLSNTEYKKTFKAKMINITGKEDDYSLGSVIDIMTYVDVIPKADLKGNLLND